MFNNLCVCTLLFRLINMTAYNDKVEFILLIMVSKLDQIFDGILFFDDFNEFSIDLLCYVNNGK